MNEAIDGAPISNQLAKLAETILSQMMEGADQWYMPWHRGLEEPVNLVTGRVFKGRNAAILWDACQKRGYDKNRWATLKQWAARRGKVRRGAKGVRVFVPIHNLAADFFDGESNELAGFRKYHVFNVEDINNFNPDHPDLFQDEPERMVEDSHIDNLVEKSGADILYQGNHACYLPVMDQIHMPPKQTFVQTPHTTASEGFYSTLVHEIIHWTKRDNRSPRPNLFEDHRQSYAFEELVAELGAAMVCTRFGQKIEPRKDHAAYLNSWLPMLENDFRYFYRALYQAQEAVHWLYRFTGMIPDGWVLETEDQGREHQATRTPVQATEFRIEFPAHRGFILTARLFVVCGECGDDYTVTLGRGDESSACPHCFRMNLHLFEW